MALVMLDLSAAFDMIDYNILIGRMEYSYGISGSALAWFRSYLSGRSQQVAIDKTVSSDVQLCLGVPQGSVMGHVFTACFLNPLVKYADVMTCPITVMPTTPRTRIADRLQQCHLRLRRPLFDHLSSDKG